MYVAVKGGERAVKNSQLLVAQKRRGDTNVPKITPDQIKNQLGLGVDRVMAEGSLYDEHAAAMAIQQAQGDMTEAIFLVRAFRTTLQRFGNSIPVETTKMAAFRRVSGTFKDIPGGQILGPTYDYTHRLIESWPEDDTEDTRKQPLETKKGTADPGTASHDAPDFAGELHRVIDILQTRGLMQKDPAIPPTDDGEDLTRQPLSFPASRSLRLQALARGDEGFLLGSAYSLQRGFGLDRHPFLGELKIGYAAVWYTPPELGFKINIGRIKLTECFMVNRQDDAPKKAAGFETGYGLVFGQNERKAMAMSLLDRSLRTRENTEKADYPAQDPEFVLSHCDNVESSGFVQHLKLPHYVDFQSELVFVRSRCKDHVPDQGDR
ncbi:MAG: carbon-phosphorus lyase complex subunit PhnI [Desulfotignum sp.]